MYANILLSTDGSDVARKGVKHGIALALCHLWAPSVDDEAGRPLISAAGQQQGWVQFFLVVSEAVSSTSLNISVAAVVDDAG